jgi:hypothetical protein
MGDRSGGPRHGISPPVCPIICISTITDQYLVVAMGVLTDGLAYVSLPFIIT